ncbi:MAG: type VII secretion target [Segniliparus sp.]|uniref:type VII secretion target n=1 Tax=Segniliparus sp. TaxID=2804064 RepID=UPI003F3206B7
MGFSVDPDAIRDNAQSLRDISDGFGTIGESGKNTDLGMNVFGVLGQPFAAVLRLVTKAAGSGIESYGKIIGHTAEQLDKAAEQIDRRDEEAADYLAQ